VAGYASGGIIRSHVIWCGRAIGLRVGIVSRVAAVAVRRRVASRVVPSDVAVRARINHWPNRARDSRAWRQHMRTLQGEARGAMVKLSVCPEKCVVARRAQRSGEGRRNMVRHVSAKRRRAVPRRLMAAVAIRVCRRERVVVVDVTVRAGVHLARWR